MPIPDYQTLMRPLLAYGQDGAEKNIGEAIKALADEFHLTEQERTQLLPSGKQSLFSNRVHWARTYLDHAGAIKKTRRSHFEITERGRELLQKHPKRIDISVLNHFPEFVAFRSGKPSDEEAHPESAEAILPHQLVRQLPRKQSKEPKKKSPEISKANCWSAYLNFPRRSLSNSSWI
jgi:restriction system protein